MYAAYTNTHKHSQSHTSTHTHSISRLESELKSSGDQKRAEQSRAERNENQLDECKYELM